MLRRLRIVCQISYQISDGDFDHRPNDVYKLYLFFVHDDMPVMLWAAHRGLYLDGYKGMQIFPGRRKVGEGSEDKQRRQHAPTEK